ncbi:DUF4282 domain-containing protein [Actinomadura macrotermitis]|uniref:DUF4282 domain-containing protein n=1 Tax=Actinomadura macrotermitis TaxID=2585200 RepID=A0A7K0BRQ4_9ACTN|nr:DUF4282 domain-containing protein [Actinomadura macrotermitis]MQY03868.1 hypothetical protein [Actinomadura macrotermitis]
MTHPSDPGQPQRPPAPGGYGPPPPHQQRHTGPIPAQRPAGPGPQQPPPPGWAPPERTDKSLVGALFDANFNYLVTPKLIKVFYILSLMLISLSSLMVVAIGIWIAQLRNGWLVGLLVMGSSPFIWIFEAILARIFMEAVVVRFKGVEHLRVIKDKI